MLDSKSSMQTIDFLDSATTHVAQPTSAAAFIATSYPLNTSH